MDTRIDWLAKGPRLAAAMLLPLILMLGCSPSVSPEPAPTKAVTSSVASTGVGTMEEAIESYVRAGSGGLDNITSIIVTVKGRVVTEDYRGRGSADQQTHIWSVTKSVLSTLVGIAMADELLTDLDETLPTLLPDYAEAMSPQVASITLGQLLTMTSGMPGDDVLGQLKDTDLETFLSLPLTAEPGTQFLYSSASSELVAAVLTEAVGEPLLDYAREKLFDPLQINTRPAYAGVESFAPSTRFERAGFSWATTSDGIHHGCCLMKLTGRDMQKIGQLYLNQGRWRGRQIVPASWVKLATSPGGIAPDYGLLWWIRPIGGHHAYAAIGRDGQIIQVVPDLQAVITVSSRSNPDLPLDADMIFPLISDVVLPRIS